METTKPATAPATDSGFAQLEADAVVTGQKIAADAKTVAVALLNKISNQTQDEIPKLTTDASNALIDMLPENVRGTVQHLIVVPEKILTTTVTNEVKSGIAFAIARLNALL